jgi:hypothetical protein
MFRCLWRDYGLTVRKNSALGGEVLNSNIPYHMKKITLFQTKYFKRPVTFLTPWGRVFLQKPTVSHRFNIIAKRFLLWNQKMYYPHRKCQLLDPVRSQTNPVYFVMFYFLKIHFNSYPPIASASEMATFPHVFQWNFTRISLKSSVSAASYSLLYFISLIIFG